MTWYTSGKLWHFCNKTGFLLQSQKLLRRLLPASAAASSHERPVNAPIANNHKARAGVSRTTARSPPRQYLLATRAETQSAVRAIRIGVNQFLPSAACRLLKNGF